MSIVSIAVLLLVTTSAGKLSLLNQHRQQFDQKGLDLACPPHCLKCIDENICTICDQEHHWTNSADLCVCQAAFYQNKDTCEACSLGCISCLSTQKCDICDTDNHWQINYGLCSCSESYILTNSTCLSCASLLEGCQLCQSEIKCTVCKEGYDLNLGSHKCTLSPEGTIKVVTAIFGGVLVVSLASILVWKLKGREKKETILEGEEGSGYVSQDQ